MFCHKCGIQSIEDAEFCQHCGSKLIVEDMGLQTSEVSAPMELYYEERIKKQAVVEPVATVEQRITESVPPQVHNDAISESTAKPSKPELIRISEEDTQIATPAVSSTENTPVKASTQEKKKMAVVLVPALIIITALVVLIFVLSNSRNNPSDNNEDIS